MGYPTDDDFAEAHGWNKGRPRLSQADVVRLNEVSALKQQRDELASALKYCEGALKGVRDVFGRGMSEVLNEAIKRAGKALKKVGA